MSLFFFRWLRWFLCDLRDGARADHVSGDWLKGQTRLEARIEYHGPSIQWPIDKLAAESPAWWKRRKAA